MTATKRTIEVDGATAAALESLAEGTVVNRIRVDQETEHFAKLALERMLALP